MITVVGIGPGAADLRLAGTAALVAQADVVIGSKRQLAEFDPQVTTLVLPHLDELGTYLKAHRQLNIILLASGDPLLYGIGNWVLKQLPASEIKIIPGISSIQYCFHQLGLSMNDVYLTSSHGRQPDFDFLLHHDKVGMVTDQVIGPVEIAVAIRKRKQHRVIYVGENLSYSNEKISRFTETTVPNQKFGMNVVIITNA